MQQCQIHVRGLMSCIKTPIMISGGGTKGTGGKLQTPGRFHVFNFSSSCLFHPYSPYASGYIMAVTFSVLTFFTGDQALTARVHLLGISSSHHGQIVSTCRHPLAYRTTTGGVFADK